MRHSYTPCSASCLLKGELPGSEMMTGRTTGTKDIRFPLMFRGLGGAKAGNLRDISSLNPWYYRPIYVAFCSKLSGHLE